MVMSMWIVFLTFFGTLVDQSHQTSHQTVNANNIKEDNVILPLYHKQPFYRNEQITGTGSFEKVTPLVTRAKWRFRLLPPAAEIQIHQRSRRKNIDHFVFSNFESERISKTVQGTDVDPRKVDQLLRTGDGAKQDMAPTKTESSGSRHSGSLLTSRKNRRDEKIITDSQKKLQRPHKHNLNENAPETWLARSENARFFTESPIQANIFTTVTVEFGHRLPNKQRNIRNPEHLRLHTIALSQDIGLKEHSKTNDRRHRNNISISKLKEQFFNESIKDFQRATQERKKTCRLSPNGQRWRCLKRKRKKMAKNLGGELRSTVPDLLRDSKAREKHENVLHEEVNRTQNISMQNKNFKKEMSDSCSCNWSPKKCECICVGSLDFNDFMRLSERFRPCEHFTFILTGGHYYALPPNLFSNLQKLRTFSLTISNATFEHLLDPTPTASSFTGISFSGSAQLMLKNVAVRRSWNWGPLEELRGVRDAQTSILVDECDLRRLASDFSRISDGRVGDVSIVNSNVTMIGSSAFVSFEVIKTLRLPDNRLAEVRREDLPKRPLQLRQIDLRNNMIEHLGDDMFDGMPALEEVYLSGNPLKTLPEKTFQVISKVRFSGISDLPLTCDCGLQWLKDPKLGGNEMIQKNLKGTICKRPRHLRGTPFENLSKEHLICV